VGQGHDHAEVPLASRGRLLPRPGRHRRRDGHVGLWCVAALFPCCHSRRDQLTDASPFPPANPGILDIPYPKTAISLARVLWGAIGWSVGAMFGAAVAARERQDEGRTILFGAPFSRPPQTP
jgi:hypothetical protein